MAEPAARARLLRGNPAFRALCLSRAVSFVGDGITTTVLVLLIAAGVGLLLLANALPRLGGPLAGVLVDRVETRRFDDERRAGVGAGRRRDRGRPAPVAGARRARGRGDRPECGRAQPGRGAGRPGRPRPPRTPCSGWLATTPAEDVKEVRLSHRLTTSVACLVGDPGGLTPTLEKMYRAMGQEPPKVKRILELNPRHALVTGLNDAHGQRPETPA